MATTPSPYGGYGYGNLTDPCPDCFSSCVPDDPFCNPFPPPPPVTTNLSLHPKSHLLQTLLIAAAAVLAASFILLLATYFIHRLRRRRRRHRRLLSILPTDSLPGADVEHHVWNIRTVGLEESVIRSIATTVYRAKDGLVGGGTDCAVCLGDLRDGEILRLLPNCEHAFHVPCIDRWLRSHLTCPLCRSPILASDDHPPPAIPGALLRSSSSTDQTESTEEGGLQVQVVVEPTLASSSELPGLQPVRRSVSMDAGSLAVLLLRAEMEEKPADEIKKVTQNRGGQVGNGKGIERSMSNRSARFFLSRHRRWNSVLPF